MIVTCVYMNFLPKWKFSTPSTSSCLFRVFSSSIPSRPIASTSRTRGRWGWVITNILHCLSACLSICHPPSFLLIFLRILFSFPSFLWCSLFIWLLLLLYISISILSGSWYSLCIFYSVSCHSGIPVLVWTLSWWTVHIHYLCHYLLYGHHWGNTFHLFDWRR